MLFIVFYNFFMTELFGWCHQFDFANDLYKC